MDLERLFLRYRATGDVDALGRCFDRAAPALLRVARHVSGSKESAQDLLQATFLTAMEKASTYDPARPLLPWLTGILVRHAAWARRTGGRTPDPDRLDVPLPRDPADLVSEDEVNDVVERAIATLPARYRPLVVARLRDGARGVDLARSTGQSAGVVRMQLHRGLLLLRRALPASLVPSLAFFLWSRRALAATRAEVLAHAGAPGAAAATSLLGGMLVAKKTLIGAGLLLATGAGWLVMRDPAPLPVPMATTPVVVDVAQQVAVWPVVSEADRTVEARKVTTALPDGAAGSRGAPEDAFPTSYLASLSGVTGRLVEADGTPVAGERVVLVEARPGELLADLELAFGEATFRPRLEAARGETEADGTFTLVGAHARGIHALRIDPSGPRSTLRVLDVALRPGAVTDLGVVTLTAGVALTGRVVDEEGAPIGGARVRAAALPGPIAAVGAEHWTDGARLMRIPRDGGTPAVFTPPSWVDEEVRGLPIPTTVTAPDGSFTLGRVPGDLITILVDAADRPAHVFGPVPSGGGDARDAGTLVVPTGRTVDGVVLDHAGAPVADVTVVAGTVPPLGPIVVAPLSTVTDGDGRFRVGPVPEDGAVIVVARRAPWHRWAAAGPTDDETVTLTLPPAGRLTVAFVDEHDAPVLDVAARVVPRVDLDELGDYVGCAGGAAARADGERFSFDSLPVGAYHLVARSPRFGIVRRTVTVDEAGTTIVVRLEAPRALTVRVVDARTGAAVEHARVTLFESTERPALATARTAPDGSARLGPVTDDSDTWTLRLEHPGYAPRYEEIDPAQESVEVRLGRGGALAGRILTRGNPPAEVVTMHLRSQRFEGIRRHPIDDELPWLATTDARGDVFFPLLAPGRYHYEVRPADLRADAIDAVLSLEGRSSPLRRGMVLIEDGETTELRIELVGGDAATASVRGRVTQDGAPVTEARVQCASTDASGEKTYESMTTQADGRFELSGLPAGDASLTVALQQGPITGVARRIAFVLTSGELRTQDVDLRSLPVPVRVVKGGLPVDGAQVSLQDDEERWLSVTSDARGDAPLRTFAPGPIRIRVQHDLGIAHREVVVPDGGLPAPLEIVLQDGIPFAGRFTLDDELADAGGPLALRVAFYDGQLFSSRTVPLDEGARTFRVFGLDAGMFWVELRAGDLESEKFEFELDVAGDDTLEFAFEAD